MISILCPSRNRAKMLDESLTSLGAKGVEWLVRVDDDEDMTVYDRFLGRKAPLVMVEGPRVGYKNFHLMANELAVLANGEWLMLWNDDALMLTPDWAEKIEAQDASKPVVLNFFDPMNPRNNLFPVISRPMYEAMGHFSLSTHCDSWVQDIANELGIHVPVYGIEAKHIRELIWDETKTASQGAYAETSPLHDSPEMVELRRQDIKKIKEIS